MERLVHRRLRVTARLLGVLAVFSLPAALEPSEPICQTTDDTSGEFTDSRDGNVYRWVKIGDQVWLAENLRFKTKTGSWCWENTEDSCVTRGRLYNWPAAMQAAPPGWHVPSDDEWKKLEIALGLTPEQADEEAFRIDDDSLLAGKIKRTDAWRESYAGTPISITNESGFSAVGSGIYANGSFNHNGYAGWWTSTDSDSLAWIRHIGFFDNTIDRVLNRKEFAYAVRCVRDRSDSTGSEQE